jgi:hypothetical protein
MSPPKLNDLRLEAEELDLSTGIPVIPEAGIQPVFELKPKPNLDAGQSLS